MFRESKKYELIAITTFQDPLGIPLTLINNSRVTASFQIPESMSATYVAKTLTGSKVKF